MLSRTLSPRELTILQLSAWGVSNKAIAQRLQISIKTVEAHKSNAMRKLGLADRSQLVRRAVELGWLSLDRAPEIDTPTPGPPS